MRPVRALGWIALLVVAWLWWRAPIVAVELNKLSAAAHFAEARALFAVNKLADAGREARLGLREAPGDRRGVALLVRLANLAHPMLARNVDVEQPHPPVPISIERARVAFLVLRRPALSSTRSTTAPVPEQPVSISSAHETPAEKADAAILQATSNKPPLADEAYRLLAAGDRRQAATAFRAALTQSPDDPRAPMWKRQLALLGKRWSGSAYSLLRASGASDLAARPVLGGGQSGAQIAYALDPLAARPLSLEARLSAPNSGARDGAQAALGVAWQVHPAVSLTVERLFAIGNATRGRWTARMAGGAATSRPAARSIWTDASIYAEAGVVGVHDTAYYGAIQGGLGKATTLSSTLTLSAGIGGWASLQRDARTVSRVELGPTLRVRAGRIEASADYRVRVAGNAAPGSGPVVTLAAFF